MNTTMYDKLLQLPLFQGLCKNDMTKIMEKVRLNFQHFHKGDRVFSQGDTCQELSFLLDGTLIAETIDNDNHYILTEELGSPFIIEPYSIYGMHTTYDSSYFANEEVGVLSIDKSYILRMLQTYPIFLLNMVNILSSRAKTMRRSMWSNRIGSSADRKIVSFLNQRCVRPNGYKKLIIRMADLSTMISEPRINVSKALNEFERLGLAELNRRTVTIPTMEDLTKYVFEVKAKQ